MRTDRGLERLITFLDAIVAIAITLLVLPLVELLRPAPHVELSQVLRANVWVFGGFLLSFAVIGRLWRAHHRLVERVGGYDETFVVVNLLWALTIVFLPFATQAAADYGSRSRLALGLYIGTMALSSVFLSVIGLLVWRRPELRRAGAAQAGLFPRAALLGTAALLVALGVGLAFPAVGYFALLLVLLTGRVERLLPDRDGSERRDPPSREAG